MAGLYFSICLLSPIGAQPTESLDHSAGETNLSLQLENCRQGLTDAEARPEDRKRWAQLLFTLDAPSARPLILELLGDSRHPGAQKALCEAIAERGRTDPSLFYPELVDLLIARLDSADPQLRSTAASALAVFDSADLAERLGHLASSDAASEPVRLAAVEALAAHMDRRCNVRELIRLLEVPHGEITNRVFAILEPTTKKPPGRDAAPWREWWQRQEKLSDEAWLSDRVELYGDRLFDLQRELEGTREAHQRQLDAMRIHLVDLQREVHRMLAPEERTARLIQWLAAPVNEVRLTALAMIRARIADDGRPPEGPLRDAILPLLRDPSLALRRQSLLIVQHLNDPLVVEAVRNQLDLETDVGIRASMLKALGRMAATDAVPTLMRETANPLADIACVREAILALGEMAERVDDAALRDTIAGALQSHYRRLGPEEVILRAALLHAMGSVGDPAFQTNFDEALNSTNPELLRPGIRGVKALRLNLATPRLRTLASDGDPLIRSAALDALGILGSEDADMESLLSRLNPTIESNEDVREAAWRAFKELVKRRPVTNQFALALRLPESTDLPLRFLEHLATTLEGQTEHALTLDAAYERLGVLHVGKERYVEASACLKKLYDLRVRSLHENSAAAALQWLAATLRSDRENDVAAVIAVLAEASEERIPAGKIVETVSLYLASPGTAVDSSRIRRLHDSVREAAPENATRLWPALVQQLENKARESEAAAKDATNPAG